MKSGCLIFVFIISLTSIVHAQKFDNVWMIGYHGYGFPNSGAVIFTNGTVDTIPIPYRPMTFWTTNTSISDSGGKILFYSNGIYIGNKKNDSLINSKDFNPGSETDYWSQNGLPDVSAVIILPFSSDTNHYNIFSLSGEEVKAHGVDIFQPLSLKHSVSDLRIDSGNGGIDSSIKAEDVIIDTLLAGHLAACRHGNGRDWWLVMHGWYNNIYYKLLITPNGIEGPFVQTIGSVITYDFGGEAAFSPNGSKFAFMSQQGDLDILDFDRCSGNFSNLINIKLPLDTPYEFLYGFDGCVFSPSGQFLYVNDNYHIYQFNTESADVASSRQIVGIYRDSSGLPPNATIFGVMQLAPDNKIYVGTSNGYYYFHAINQPDSEGIKCNFKMYQLTLPDYNFDIPTFPNYKLKAETGSACDTLTSAREFGIMNHLLRVSPNPNIGIGEIIIQNENYRPAQLVIENTLGEKVFSQNIQHWLGAQSFNITYLNKGIYFIKVKINANEFVGKIVKQ